MIEDRIVKSTCELCLAGCGVLIHMKDGKPVKVEGDPDNPINNGIICAKGAHSLEYLYHPDRLKHPLKRTGKRGDGKWQQITWDEALDTTAAELTKAKEQYGAESVAFIRGGAKGLHDGYLGRLANTFGTPNNSSMGSVCHFPRQFGAAMTYGLWSVPDYAYPPACILMWAQNPANSGMGEHHHTIKALEKGSKLIVIDPWETGYAQKAEIWIKPRPCTDLALALGIINVIINEDLYDKEFVEKWTVGFDKLKAHVQEYTPKKVEGITWVPAVKIKEVARYYATHKPAAIAWGNGIDNNINNFQSARAISILRAISGNLHRPGGDIEWAPSGAMIKTSPKLVMPEALPADMAKKRLKPPSGILPPISYAPGQILMRSILEGKPYQIHAAYVQGGSLLHTYANSREARKALEKVDFLAVSDFFMIPTAQLADIVLPVGTFLEVNSVHQPESPTTTCIIQKVAQIGECWSDYRILSQLAKRLGLGKHFWEDDEQVLDFVLKGVGLTFEEFRKVGILPGHIRYRNHEKDGFATPSKKVEIYSDRLKEWGFDPLPVYHEPPESPLSEPKLAREYPLVFTNRKLEVFKHSGERQIAGLRSSHPDPLVAIHPETAGKLGIVDGDWVYVETKRGKIKQRAALSSKLDPRIVIPEYGWWFPEKGSSELSGWAESNLNVLTYSEEPCARELGSSTLRGLLCKVYKAA